MLKTCPSCGKTDDETEFVGAFCSQCYARRVPVFKLPRNLRLRICPRCTRVLAAGGEWTGFTDDFFKQWILRKVKSPLEVRSARVSLERGKNGFHASLELVFDADGAAVEKSANAFVEVDKSLCDECHKASGGYHEAVIQLRGANLSKLRSLAKKLAEGIRKTSFVSGCEEKKEGIDFLAGSRAAAMQEVNALGKPFTLSHKLTGMRDGKRVYRATICIRL